jgi:hypothetical protein
MRILIGRGVFVLIVCLQLAFYPNKAGRFGIDWQKKAKL